MLPMKSKVVMDLAKQLAEQRRLTEDEYAHLIRFRTAESSVYLAKRADQIRKKIYKNHVYIRGLIEISNICRNDCYYCGIRRSNTACERYRLTKQQILGCCREGYELGFRTFVMQGGEGTYPVGKIADIVKSVKERYSDCAVTLSLGEYTRAEYEIMRDAGADRYLLRHETADREHYRKLHPAVMSWENRMRCLYDLKELGFPGRMRVYGRFAVSDSGESCKRPEVHREIHAGYVRDRSVYSAAGHAVSGYSCRERGTDSLSAVCYPPDKTEYPAAGDDRARHDHGKRQGAGDTGRSQCYHAESVSTVRTEKVFSVR